MALLLVMTACGGDDTATTDAPTTTETTTTTAAPTSSSVPGTSAPTSTVAPTTTTTTTTAAPTTTTTMVTTTTLAGEPIDIGPSAGDVIGVVGVEHDDVLNVRSGPGVGSPIVATLAPTANNVTALGNARQLTQSIWFEVRVGSVTGWASSRFLAYIGLTDDITSSVVADLGGIPEAETMAELGLIVAGAVASTDPPSRITMTVAPAVGDLGEVTYDVVGLGDDSVFGLRLHVFGQPAEGGEGFVLKSVEATSLCGRGLAPGGLCV